MRFTRLQTTGALLFFLTAGCGADSTTGSSAPPLAPLADGLWIASGGAVLRLSADQLLASARSAAATAVTMPTDRFADAGGIALDRDGTVWIADLRNDALLAFTPASLRASGTAEPTTVISSHSGSLSAPFGIAFDRDRHLWVANTGSGTVVRFDQDQLVASGNPVPTIVLFGLVAPYGLAFDPAGALWVTDRVAGTISKFTPGQLAASGSAPDVTLALTGGPTIESPGIAAFDGAGNLWVPITSAGTIVSFTPAQQATTGAPTPHVILSGERSEASPTGLAFDRDGNLWLTGGGPQLSKLDREVLGESGTPVASVRLTVVNSTFIHAVAFWPIPPGLPIS